MFPYKRVLVALDLTEMDSVLMKYASYLTKIFEIDTIYFFHVAKSLELPEGMAEKYPDLIAPTDESLEKIIREKIELFFECESNTEIKIEVREGNAFDRILRWSDIKAIDLMLTGRKSSLKGSGILPGRLAKMAHCSMLFIPEKSTPGFSRIMVPVDFSKSALQALMQAKQLAEKANAKLILQNTYTVPSGYHYTGKSYDEFAEIMKEHAKNNALKFLSKAELNATSVDIVLSLDDDTQPADKINMAAEDNACDVIVMSSKGRTELANMLLGSVADKILSMKTDIPVLIIKDKKENLGFLEALLRL